MHQIITKSENEFLRGFSILIIIMSHIGIGGNMLRWILPSNICIFVFSSAYGLIRSYKNNPKYLENFLYNKLIKKIVFPYVVIGIIIADIFSVGIPTNLEEIQILGRNWYVEFTIFVYVAFYFVFKYVKNMRIQNIVSLATIMIYVCVCLLMNRTSTWYQATGVLILGGFVAEKENDILKALKDHYISIVAVSVLLMYFCNALTFHILAFPLSGTIGLLGVCVFNASTFLLLAVGTRNKRSVAVKNNLLVRYLCWVGKESYYYYLIHPVLISLILKINNNQYVILFVIMTSISLLCWLCSKLKGK